MKVIHANYHQEKVLIDELTKLIKLKGNEKPGSNRQVWKLAFSEAAGNLDNTEHTSLRSALPVLQFKPSHAVEIAHGKKVYIHRKGSIELSSLSKVEGKIIAWKWRVVLMSQKYKNEKLIKLKYVGVWVKNGVSYHRKMSWRLAKR